MHNISTKQQRDKYRNHAQVWELLPWYINGSLSAEEKQQIAEHTAVCLICRKELGLQSALRDSVKHHELDELMVNASFDRLSAKLRDQDAGQPVEHQDTQSGLQKSDRGLANIFRLWLQRKFKSGYFVAALSVLAIVAILSGFTAQLLLRNNTFKTLSNGLPETPAAADLRLIFADGVADSERDAILDNADLSIVAGPDDRGLYLVNADKASASALQVTLEQLQGNEKILFAEIAVSPAPESQPSGER